jgi:hypothetical protein
MANEKMEYTITQEKVIDILIHAANRQDFAEFKRDIHQNIAEFKQEIKSDIAEFKQEIRADIAEFKQEVKADIHKLDGRIDKLDGRIDKLDGRIDKLDGRIYAMMAIQITTLLFLFATIGIPYIKGFFS